MALMNAPQVCGYALTSRAANEANLSGMTIDSLRHILAQTVAERRARGTAGLWFVTDGLNTALISPIDSCVTSVCRGVIR